MHTSPLLRDAISWEVQVRLAADALAHARLQRPATAPQRLKELRVTRQRSEAARLSAVAAGYLLPHAKIRILR